MNELTWNLTTSIPDRNPTTPQAAMAITAEITALTPVSDWNQLMMTSAKASIAPHERSKAPAESGTSTASPRMPMTTWSPRTILNVAWVRNVSGIQSPKMTRISASR